MQERTLAWAKLDHRVWIEVTGADAGGMLHRFSTNHLLQLKAGEGCEAMFLNGKGNVIGFGEVFAENVEQGRYWLVGDGEFSASLIKHLDFYVINEKVNFVDRSRSGATLLITGVVPQVARALGLEVLADSLGSDALECRLSRSQDEALVVTNREFGGGSVLLWVSEQSLPEWEQRLTSAGARVLEVNEIESLRIAHCYPRLGQDTDEKTLTQELGRDPFAVHFNKGCYLGQETVARLDALGHVNRLLVVLQGDCELPVVGETLRQAESEKEVGRITSVAVSQSESGAKWIALANVRRLLAKPGTELLLASSVHANDQHATDGRVTVLGTCAELLERKGVS